MRILMGYRYGNIAPADSIKKAFVKMGHEVFTVGPSTDPNVKQDYEKPDKMLEKHAGVYYYDTEKLVTHFGGVDLILMVEPGVYFYNLSRTYSAPTAFWLIDILLVQDHPWIQEFGSAANGEGYMDDIDFIFTAKYNHLPRYHNRGITKVTHLPLAFESDAHKQVEAEKVYDIVFLGRTDYAERKHYMDLLRLEYNCFVGTGLIYEDYCRKIAQGKIAFNHGHIGELNMRFFELFAMGALQFCTVCHAQELLGFEDGVHLVNYACDKDLLEWLHYYLKDGDEPVLKARRDEIAQAGKEKVQGHSYEDRARLMLETIFG